MNIARRLRGMFRTAGVWAVAWTLPGLAWVGSLALRLHDASQRMSAGEFVSTVLLNWTAVGAISGAAFAVALSVAERRRASLATLSMRRVASWGAVGGVALPIVLIPLLSAKASNPLQQLVGDLVVYGALGAVSAVASLYLARRAAPDVPSAASRADFVSPAT